VKLNLNLLDCLCQLIENIKERGDLSHAELKKITAIFVMLFLGAFARLLRNSSRVVKLFEIVVRMVKYQLPFLKLIFLILSMVKAAKVPEEDREKTAMSLVKILKAVKAMALVRVNPKESPSILIWRKFLSSCKMNLNFQI